MRANKHGINNASIETYILSFVLILVLFKVVASLFPSVVGGADDLNKSGFPLAELFMSGGAVWYLVAAGIIFLIYKSFTPKK